MGNWEHVQVSLSCLEGSGISQQGEIYYPNFAVMQEITQLKIKSGCSVSVLGEQKKTTALPEVQVARCFVSKRQSLQPC